MALELCCTNEGEITPLASGVGGDIDDRIVKSTGISHASGMFFSSGHVVSMLA